MQTCIRLDERNCVFLKPKYLNMKSKSKKNKKQQFSSVKALLKADREKEIEQYGKQVSMRPSKVHKSKKDYDRKKNKVSEGDLD